MPGLSKKETARLLTHVENQGVAVTAVKNGFMLRLPNGESTIVHLSVSDHRGPANMRAFLKRNGIDWPTDKNTQKLAKGTIEKGNLVLKKIANPRSIRLHDFIIACGLIDWYPAHHTATKFLTFAGYESVGNTIARRFVMPDEIEVVEVKEEQRPIVSIAKTPLPALLEKETTLEVREFLDTHDSWVVNMDIIPESISVSDMRKMFAAVGLSFEVRVWK